MKSSLNAPRIGCTADLKPPAVDNCSAFPVKQTVLGAAGDITPDQMAEVYLEIINHREAKLLDMRMNNMQTDNETSGWDAD